MFKSMSEKKKMDKRKNKDVRRKACLGHKIIDRADRKILKSLCWRGAFGNWWMKSLGASLRSDSYTESAGCALQGCLNCGRESYITE